MRAHDPKTKSRDATEGVPPRAEPGTRRCLLAVNETEKNLLLGDRQLDELRATVGEMIHVPTEKLAPEQWPALLLESGCEVLVAAWSTPPIPEELPAEGQPLRYVCSLVGGVKRHVSRDQIERGLLVTNWGSSISRTIAESALMLILMALRRTAYWHEVLHHQNGWRKIPGEANALSLFERRVGVHGFGRVARELVGLLRPFGVRITTYCPSVPDELLGEFGVKRAESLEALFSQNDVLVELAGLTDETYKSVTEPLLRSLPDDGVFVNVGRGPVVDEEALIRVAREDRIRIALDVFCHEPLSEDSPLRRLNNVVLMPHQSGPTRDRMRDVGAFALENLGRYFNGQPLEALIDPFLYEHMT